MKSLARILADTHLGKKKCVGYAVHYVITFHLMEIISKIIGNMISQFFKSEIICENSCKNSNYA